MGTLFIGPPPTVDLYLRYGADLVDFITWSSDGTLVDFTGATGRWAIVIDGVGDVCALSTTISAFGGLTLGTESGGNPGVIDYSILKPATMALAQAYSGCGPCLFGGTTARGAHALYVDWPDGTSTCLLRGNTYLGPGVA